MSKSHLGWRKAGLASFATTALVCTSVFTAGGASAVPGFELIRIGGEDRYETSALVAVEYGNTTDAILANGEPGNFADALAANFLSGELDAPVLLTRDNRTPEDILTQLDERGVVDITVVGGEDRVSVAQVQQLEQLGYNVTRIAGDNRFLTNAEVIEEGGQAVNGVGLIATGFDFPDALAAGPISYQGHPLGLTSQDDISDDVIAALKAAGVTQVLIFGGTDAVGAQVVAKLAANQITVLERFAGDNRTETSTLAADFATTELGFVENAINIASGANRSFGADALSGGPLTGKQMRPLLITQDEDTPRAVLDYINANDDQLETGNIFGGPSAITLPLETLLEEAGQGEAPAPGEPTLDIAPGDAVTLGANETRDYTVSGLEDGQYRVTLVNSENVTVDADGNYTFDEDGDTGLAAAGMVASDIISVNGTAPADPEMTQSVGAIEVTDGEITFTVESEMTEESFVPVVYTDGGDNTRLELDENGNPVEPFGVGGETTVDVPTNQDFMVEPATGETVNTTEDDTTEVTFSGIDAEQVNLALVNSNQVSVADNGTVTFADETGDANEADLVAPGNADIDTINGVSSTYGTSRNNVDVNDDGTVTVTVDTNGSGDVRLVAYVDADDQNDLDLGADNAPTEAFAVSGNIVTTNPDDVVATPDNATTPYGEEVVTAQLVEGTGANNESAEAGVAVRFTQFDENNDPVNVATSTTDENGQATYAFTVNDPDPTADNGPTAWRVSVEADLDGNGQFDDGASDDANGEFTDDAAQATAIQVEAPDAQVRTGENVTTTATVVNQFGDPVAGEEVLFTVDQPTSADLTTTRTTDENGQASFTFTANEAGTYGITVDSQDTTGVSGMTSVTAVENGVENARTGEIFTDVDAAEADFGTGADSVRSGDTLQVFGDAEADGFTLDVAENLTVVGTDSDAVTGPISIVGVDDHTISGFEVTPGDGTAVGLTEAVAFYVSDTEGFTISDNTVVGADLDLTDAERGIVNNTQPAAEVGTVSGNTFRRLTTAIYADDSADLAITGNTFDGNNVGVVAGDEAVEILDNTFTSNAEAVSFIVPDATATGNSFADNDVHVSDYTGVASNPGDSSYDLEQVIADNTFDEPVEVVPATDAAGAVEQIVDES